MKRPSALRPIKLSDQAHAELVRSLFATLLPSVLMSMLFVGVAMLATYDTADLVLLGLTIVGTILSAFRLGVVFFGRCDIDQRTADRASAAAQERRFGASYIAFALVLGLFGARAMMIPLHGLHMVISALLVGYAAGVAAGISLRPRIGSVSMMLAVVPAAAVSLTQPDTFHIALGIILFVLLVGGLNSMHVRYRGEVEKIELRRTMSGMARHDHLTGLSNRLGLAEAFEDATGGNDPGCLIAIHCLDLDRFKPVNDSFGHPVGDKLLQSVATRLIGSIRQGDIAARIGGDEFVVLQRGMRHEDEAELLAIRLVRGLGEAYDIDDHEILIGASIGYVVSHCSDSIDELITRADNALYAIKGIGGGAAAYSHTRVDKVSVH